jgi:hypothetical protein
MKFIIIVSALATFKLPSWKQINLVVCPLHKKFIKYTWFHWFCFFFLEVLNTKLLFLDY